MSRWLDQTIMHTETTAGNCMQAAVASLLNLPLFDVPHFALDGDRCHLGLMNFVESYGFALIHESKAMFRDGLYLACGPTERGTHHMVIYQDAKLFYDPHPSRANQARLRLLPRAARPRRSCRSVRPAKGCLMPNALWLPDVLRAAGLKVAEQPGWQTRDHGPMGIVKGALCHHTAGPLGSNMPSLGVVTKGRPDLAGPLCNVGLGRDGTCYVVAAGRAYHAGAGSWHGLTNGNSELIGIEADNTGLGEPWSEVQLDAYVRLCAAILKHVGADPIMAVAHREYCTPKGRKIDPAGIDMVAFRIRVAAAMNGAAPRSPIPKRDAQERPTLRRGATGTEVIALQNAIGVKADGQFGAGTESTLRAYQRAHHLVADGIAGPAVWAAIDSVRAAA